MVAGGCWGAAGAEDAGAGRCDPPQGMRGEKWVGFSWTPTSPSGWTSCKHELLRSSRSPLCIPECWQLWRSCGPRCHHSPWPLSQHFLGTELHEELFSCSPCLNGVGQAEGSGVLVRLFLDGIWAAAGLEEPRPQESLFIEDLTDRSVPRGADRCSYGELAHTRWQHLPQPWPYDNAWHCWEQINSNQQWAPTTGVFPWCLVGPKMLRFKVFLCLRRASIGPIFRDWDGLCSSKRWN